MNINKVDRTNPSDFRLFLWSDLVAQIAGVGAGLAIPVVTLRLSDSLTLAGLYGTITGIAALAGGIIGGSLADMWRRKPLIIVTQRSGRGTQPRVSESHPIRKFLPHGLRCASREHDVLLPDRSSLLRPLPAPAR